MDLKTIATIGHIIGVAVGAGSAYLSDLIFMHVISDRKISSVEIRIMEFSSKIVWLGLVLLALSGIAMFFLSPTEYLHSSKFQTKMAIILILIVNGLVLRFVHMNRIKRHQDHHYPSSDEFRRHAVWMILSGVISLVSWTMAIILGSIRNVEFSFLQLSFIYLFIVLMAFAGGVALKNRIFFHEK